MRVIASPDLPAGEQYRVVSADNTCVQREYHSVIKAFKSWATRRLFEGQRVPRFANISKVAMRKLQMLHAAQRIEALRGGSQQRRFTLEGLEQMARI